MPRETVIINGRTCDVLTCDTCGKTFHRPSSKGTCKVVVKVYCSVACSRKAAGDRWRDGSLSLTFGRHRSYKERMV